MVKNGESHKEVTQKRALLFCLAVAVFVAPIAYAVYDLRDVGGRVDYPAVDYRPPSVSPKGRILVILLDSTRKDFAFSERMPYLSGLRERGAWGVSQVVSIPVTISGASAIFSGTLVSPLVVFQDYQPSATTADNLFKRVKERGGRSVIFSESLQNFYANYVDLKAFVPKTFIFSEYGKETDYIFEQAYRFLKEEQWDLAVVPFYGPDLIGHLETPGSPKYSAILGVVDDYVRRLVGLAAEGDVVLITSEHGMDDKGFHVDQTEMVMETPFVLLGPRVEKGGPGRILQMDWAPTLSVLAGVSPFYPSPALPALDLLKLPAEAEQVLLSGFSSHLLGTSGPMSLEELRSRRLEKMGKKGSLLVGVFIALCTFASMVLFSYLALIEADHGRSTSPRVVFISVGLLALGLLSGIGLYTKLLGSLFQDLPFSANFILAHPISVPAALAVVLLLPVICIRVLGKAASTARDKLLLFVFCLVFSLVFLDPNPYHPLNWAVLCFPLVAVGMTRRWAWFVAFGSVWAGLAIRRLTFYRAHGVFTLPDRWLVTATLLLAALTYLAWKLRGDSRRPAVLGLATLCFAPGLVAIALSSSVELRTVVMVLGVGPVALLAWREPEERDVWWALWVAFFYLGTSSNLRHTTHVLALPLLVAVWSAARGTSVVARGMMVGFLVWTLYLLPGNSFDLKLLEMNDPFILASATSEHIELTVMVIASRFILPAVVLLWGMAVAGPAVSVSSMVSVALLPVVFGTGANLLRLLSGSTAGLPWEQLVRLTVLLGYSVDLLCAFFIVAVLSRLLKLVRSSTSGVPARA